MRSIAQFCTPSPARILAAVLGVMMAGVAPSPSHAQELQTQPTPFSIWIDLQHSTLRSPSWPIWLESTQALSQISTAGRATSQTVRLRFRRFAALNQTLLLRLHFVDLPGASPVVTAWSDTAVQSFHSAPLGRQIGLATFENLTIPMAAVDYIEITVSGDGSNLLGAFLSSLGPPKGRSAVDFEQENEVADPFGADPSPSPQTSDVDLYGRVKAPLLSETVVLSAEAGHSAAVEFELESIPLLGLVSLDVLNLDPLNPPQIVLNNQPIGTLAPCLPDLADPAYQGIARPLEADLEFHYSGWLRCQGIVPASALRQGLNRIVVQTSPGSETAALRSIELQLKYNSRSFNYQLAPLGR